MYGKVHNKYDYSKSVHGQIVEGKYEVAFYDCYDAKDILKGLGYKWDSATHCWKVECAAEQIGNIVAETVVKINLPRGEFRQLLYSLESVKGIDWNSVQWTDADHAAMLNDHYKK